LSEFNWDAIRVDIQVTGWKGTSTPYAISP